MPSAANQPLIVLERRPFLAKINPILAIFHLIQANIYLIVAGDLPKHNQKEKYECQTLWVK